MSSETHKVNLLGLTEQKLKAFLSELGEKPFRAVQLMKWIHQQGVIDFDQMTNISKSARVLLKENAEIRPPELIDTFPSSDGCYKWTVRAESGSKVEMVYIPERGRGTLCVSSQVGCSLDCSFCATGKQGFNSDLTAAEIIGQVWLANRVLGGFSTTQPKIVTNVVMMGMGEPLLNFDNVMAAVELMMDDNAYGLSKRRVTISTSGVVPAIRRLIDHTDASLAVSLHAPNDELRNQLVPINRKYPISELLESVKNYLDNLSDARSATIEYTMMAGINDHRQHARELAVVLRGLPCKINLIPFNPFSGSEYRTSSNSAISNFKTLLQEAGYNVTVRKTRGDEVGAACGQLVGNVQDLTKRSMRYSKSSQSRTLEPGRVPVREI